MESSRRAESTSRRQGVGRGGLHLLKRMRRAVERTLRLGAKRGMPVDVLKRLRLCNVVALGGAIIMGGWTAIEALFGDTSALPWELLFTSGFIAVLALNAIHAHRSARIILVISTNLSVLVGALLFTESAGGMLPFFAM